MKTETKILKIKFIYLFIILYLCNIFWDLLYPTVEGGEVIKVWKKCHVLFEWALCKLIRMELIIK
jgi:hypothetical protein